MEVLHADRARPAIVKLLIASLALFAALLAGCSGGGGGAAGGGGPVPVLPPNFTNAFEGFDSTGLRFSLILFPSAPTTPTGSFDGSTSSINVYDSTTLTGTPFPVAGTFNGSSFTLTVTAPVAPVAASYDGSFVETDVIELRSTGSETLRLRRTNGFNAAVAGNWSGENGTGQPWFLQFRVNDGFSDGGDSSLLVTGTEVLNGVSSPFQGSITVQQIVLRVARASGTVTVNGQFPANGTQVDGARMTFGGTAALSRGGTPDARAAIYTTGLTPRVMRADLLGQQRDELVIPSLGVMNLMVVSPDKTRVAYTIFDGTSQLFVLEFATSTITQLTDSGAVGGTVFNFLWSPDSSSLAVIMKETSNSEDDLYAIRRDGTGFKKLTSSLPSSPEEFEWAPSGARIAFRVREIVAAPDRFDLYVDDLDGTPRREISKLTNDAQTVTDFEWSPAANRLAFVSNQGGVTFELFVAPDTGAINTVVQTLPSVDRGVGQFTWSPDAARIAFVSNVDSVDRNDLFVALADGSGLTLLSDLPAADATVGRFGFSWSPDSLSIAFAAADAPTDPIMKLYVVAGDGSTAALPISDAPVGFTIDGNGPPLWRPDSNRIVYAVTDNALSTHLIFSTVDGSELTTLSQSPVGGWPYSASWSPDGTRLAFVPSLTVDGLQRLSVANADGSNPHDVTGIASEAGQMWQYRWVGDSRRLMYTSSQDDPLSQFGPPEELYVAYADGTAGIKVSEVPGFISKVIQFEEQ